MFVFTEQLYKISTGLIEYSEYLVGCSSYICVIDLFGKGVGQLEGILQF